MTTPRMSPTGTALPPLSPQNAAKRVREARAQLSKSKSIEAAIALQRAERDHRDAVRDHLALAVDNTPGTVAALIASIT